MFHTVETTKSAVFEFTVNQFNYVEIPDLLLKFPDLWLLQNLKERKAKQKVAQLPTRTLKINEPSSECTICLEEKKFPSVSVNWYRLFEPGNYYQFKSHHSS